MHACGVHVCSWLTVDILARQTGNQRGCYTAKPLCPGFTRLAPLLKSSRLYKCRRARRFTPLVTLVRPRAERMDLGERERWSFQRRRDYPRWPFNSFASPWWIAWTCRGWNWAFRTQEAHIVMNLVLWYISRQAGIYLRDTTEMNVAEENWTLLRNSGSHGMLESKIRMLNYESFLRYFYASRPDDLSLIVSFCQFHTR